VTDVSLTSVRIRQAKYVSQLGADDPAPFETDAAASTKERRSGTRYIAEQSQNVSQSMPSAPFKSTSKGMGCRFCRWLVQ
jgi:hypothetical protein